MSVSRREAQIIEATIVAFARPHDYELHDRWRHELRRATDSGLFTPANPQELLVAVRRLLDGGTVPDFPRSG